MNHVVIVGAGPAGLSATASALNSGATVTLLDSSHQLGGQFWRHLPASRPAAHEAALHHGWKVFESLRRRVSRHSRCQIVTEAQVWGLDRRGDRIDVHVAIGQADGDGRKMTVFTPDALVLATGAHDRTLPFPGWDLVGVFTGGAAQAFAKSERVAMGERVIVAGAGPFLLPVAASLRATGARVLGVHEAARVSALTSGWGRQITTLARMPRKLGELSGYVSGQLRNRIPYHLGSTVVAAHGVDHVEAVTIARIDADWAPIRGTERVVDVDAVAISHGFTPRLELAISAGCALTPARFVEVDELQRTSTGGVFAAGELTGIGGADAAMREGAIAGWIAAGGDPADRRVASARRHVRAYRRFESAMDHAHGVRPGWRGWLRDDTVICRCEEVSYGRLRDVVDATQARGIRSIKLTTRVGLGPCQGRVCGRTVEDIVTANGAWPILDGAQFDHRPFAAPLRFSELSQIPDERRKP